jgi:predicted flap endonuclease-1-like 5' DNA nuclease
MQVKNNWKRPIRIGRQVIAKGGVEDVAEHLLLQPRVQRLRDAKKLIFPYHKEAEKQPPKPAELSKGPVADKKPASDDLTKLAHVGAGRLKSLTSAGILTFAQVVERGDDLPKVLEITKQQAAEIVKDAKLKVG